MEWLLKELASDQIFKSYAACFMNKSRNYRFLKVSSTVLALGASSTY